jgi:hypothetical protein
MAKAASLIDRFDGPEIDPSKWAVWGASQAKSARRSRHRGSAAEIAGGRLVLRTPAGPSAYVGVDSTPFGPLDLTSSFVRAKIDAPLLSGSHEVSFEFYKPGDGYANHLVFYISGGSFVACSVVDGTPDGTTIDYVPAEHSYWRIREAAGSVLFETSPESPLAQWTVHKTVEAPDWVDAGLVGFTAGHWDTEDSPTEARFDHLNSAWLDR